jgi:transcriptional regulator with PAS, ATPase and Fis domain
VPALRDRPEEIAHHIERAIVSADVSLSPDATLIEAALLRKWPGNIRELEVEVRRATVFAASAGRALVTAQDLGTAAGAEIIAFDNRQARAGRMAPPGREEIEAALAAVRGNVTRAALTLGVHRTQLQRWIARHNIDPRRFVPRRFAQ